MEPNLIAITRIPLRYGVSVNTLKKKYGLKVENGFAESKDIERAVAEFKANRRYKNAHNGEPTTIPIGGKQCRLKVDKGVGA